MAELLTVRIADLGRVVTGKTPPSSQPELFGDLHPFLTPTVLSDRPEVIVLTDEAHRRSGAWNF